MNDHTDLFVQINNAVLDLQRSSFPGFEKPLKTLGRLLQHPDLAPYNRSLTQNLDLEAFLTESEASQGSMAGSASLAWPDDKEQELGLSLLLILKLAANPEYAVGFAHTFFYTSSNKYIAGIHELAGQLIMPFVRDFKSYVFSSGRSIRPKLLVPVSKKVFIVHGHDEGARETAARFLERIGLEPIILHEQVNRGRTIIEKFEAHSDVGFAIVLLTPDDQGCEDGGTPRPRARQNVVLELGYFVGRLGRERVMALRKGNVEIPSDFAGVVYEDLDARGAWRARLGQELQAAGYSIDWNKAMQP